MVMCVMVRRYVVNARVGARRDPFELVGITCRDARRQTVFYTSLLNAEADVVAGRKGKREDQFRYDARIESAHTNDTSTRRDASLCGTRSSSNSDAVYIYVWICIYVSPPLFASAVRLDHRDRPASRLTRATPATMFLSCFCLEPAALPPALVVAMQ